MTYHDQQNAPAVMQVKEGVSIPQHWADHIAQHYLTAEWDTPRGVISRTIKAKGGDYRAEAAKRGITQNTYLQEQIAVWFPDLPPWNIPQSRKRKIRGSATNKKPVVPRGSHEVVITLPPGLRKLLANQAGEHKMVLEEFITKYLAYQAKKNAWD